MKKQICFSIALIFVFAVSHFAQTTEFTYQGKLNDAGGQAAAYDFEFRLCIYETLSCSPPLATFTKTNVTPSNGGIFTIKVDFGNGQFSGTDRYVEVAVRRTGASEYTTLSPRQEITSAPYSIYSSGAGNASSLGGRSASQYVLTTDPRLSATNYVQNGTTAQTGVNFNVGGTGTANILNAGTQFNLNNQRVLSNAGTNNLFAGTNSGAANTQGLNNSFFGTNAGRLNTIGLENSFFGNNAGDKNTSGEANSFFGASAGEVNDTGIGNSFFGVRSGRLTTSGGSNAFFGYFAGQNNTTGAQNTFVGAIVGSGNTTGFFNTFLGRGAGNANTTGSSNTAVGSFANFGANNLTYATALGAGATVASSNTLVLGRAEDAVQAPGSFNAGGSVGAGTNYRLGGSLFISIGGNASNTYNTYVGVDSSCNPANGNNGVGNTFVGYGSGQQCTTGTNNTVFGYGAGRVGTGNNNTLIGAGTRVADGVTVNDSTAIGAFATVSTSNTIVLGRTTTNTIIKGGLRVYSGLEPPSGGSYFSPAFESVNTTRYGRGLATPKLYIGSIADPVYTESPMCFQNVSLEIPYGHVGYCANGTGSRNLKKDIKAFSGGLEIIKRLSPVAFKWKENDESSIGLNAEDVAAVEPQLVNRDGKGEIRDVKTQALNVILVNAVKEQQAQIEAQQKQIEQLKKLVCATNAAADVCEENEK